MSAILSRRSFIAAVPLAIGALATLSGCGDGSDSEVLDLTGTWSDYHEDTGETYMTAIIEGDGIEVYWGEDTTDSTSLFWAGSYKAPNKATDSWSWKSKKDADKYGIVFFPSDSDTIEFTYKDGVLTFDATLFGITGTEEMRRLSSEPNAAIVEEAAEDDQYETVSWTVDGVGASAKIPTSDPTYIDLIIAAEVIQQTVDILRLRNRISDDFGVFDPTSLTLTVYETSETFAWVMDGVNVSYRALLNEDYDELASELESIVENFLRVEGAME